MAKRIVKTFSICVQPETLEQLHAISEYFAGLQCSRSALISRCIDTTYKAVLMLKEYEKNETERQ